MAISDKLKSRLFVLFLLLIIILPACYGLFRELSAKKEAKAVPAAVNETK